MMSVCIGGVRLWSCAFFKVERFVPAEVIRLITLIKRVERRSNMAGWLFVNTKPVQRKLTRVAKENDFIFEELQL